MSVARQTPAATRLAALVWLLAGLFALAVAWWVQHVEGLVPCALCLLERWPYRILALLGLIGLLLGGARRGVRLVWSLLVVLCLLSGVVLAATHVGVERHWWPDPLPECAAPHLAEGSIAERLRSMPLRPSKPCDSPTVLFAAVPALSMATCDALYAGALFCLALFAVPGPESRRRFSRSGKGL